MRILSGIQPSGRPHSGKLLRGHLAIHLASGGQPAFLLHRQLSRASRRSRKPRCCGEYTLGVALDFLALGLDPEHAPFFAQQDVPEVTELAWILSCVTPMGMLERAVSYKDKIAQGLSPNHGLFAYPVLQAADILIYLAELVPVGQDQKQHIEMTRDIAGKFNQQFGEVFVIPEPYILDSTAVVPGVDGRKMSKSYGNEIGIFEEGNALKKRSCPSSPTRRRWRAQRPDDVDPLPARRSAGLAEETAEWEARYKAGGMGYGEVKKRVLELDRRGFRSLPGAAPRVGKRPGLRHGCSCRGRKACAGRRGADDGSGQGGHRSADHLPTEGVTVPHEVTSDFECGQPWTGDLGELVQFAERGIVSKTLIDCPKAKVVLFGMKTGQALSPRCGGHSRDHSGPAGQRDDHAG